MRLLKMNDEEIKYKAFLTVWKVLGQTRPGITPVERFIAAIIATSDDKLERAKRLNQGKIDQLNGELPKTLFSDALFRQI
jgi:hypothetical protein